ncbi:hypothetical protein ACFL0Z_00620 [Patescibacteria group bacterium]
MKEDLIANLPDDEQQMIAKLSQVVDIVGEIFAEQKSPDLPGGNLYPPDLTREEFDQAAIRDPELRRFDTVVERMSASEYRAVPYNKKYSSYYQRMIPLLQEARKFSRDASFRVYLTSLISCLKEGTPETYQHMMAAWVKTKNYHINFPFTYDELYMDRLVGLKGGFNAALFLEDKELTATIDKPLRTWEDFTKSFSFPGRARNFSNLSAAVYHTVNHQGMMADMKLRAWNLPNDFKLRSEIGARQTIIRESTLQAFHDHFLPIAKEIFPTSVKRVTEEELQSGLFWTLTLHELAHNIGCYEREKELEKYHHVFEELKANVFPVIWAFYCKSEKVCSTSETEAAVTIFFAMNLMDCLLATNNPSRESYCLALLIHCNFLKEKGKLLINDKEMKFKFSNFVDANNELLQQTLEIVEKGNYDRAKKFVERYGSKKACASILNNLLKTIKIDV